ncbi:unnamed protein product [Caenorhabditis angaria]|uniref:Uncharacterized protein n=1 Tax=Caenorhabditis angaria TaxID=860376 RepID=A0A9P1IKI8_9PELO|nr:unnamed protein product [Caenorhabditis angaria]
MSEIDYPPGCQPVTASSNNNELIKRLRAIADALHDCPPNREYGEQNRFLKLFKHLSNAKFMDNSNRDVQIYLAICLASILRLFSPEMPVTEALQLKEQYLFIFRVLNNFGEVTINSPMFKRYHYLVEVIEVILQPMSEMKDLDDEEALPVYRSLIKAVLSVPCGKGWDKSRLKGKQKIIEEEQDEDSEENDEETDDEQITLKIISMLTSIAVSALHELDHVPVSILDVLFFYIVEPQKSNFLDANRMSREILQKARNQIEPSLQDILRQSMMFGELPNGFDMTGSASRAKLFDVIKSLYQIDHTMVSQAISFLCRWLESEQPADRQHAVRLVGSLTRERSCQFGLSSDDPTWKAYMKCAIDESADVRKEFVHQSIYVLTSIHSHLRGPVSNSLLRMLKDTDENVRETTISTIIQVAKIKLESVSEQLLNACAQKMLDKKVSVRLAAVKNIMSLYHHVMTSQPQTEYLLRPGMSTDNQEIENESTYTDSDRDSVAFIPKAVFNVYRLAYTMPDLIDSSALISRYFQLYFVPYKCEPKQRVEIMAKLMRKLDSQSISVFRDIVQTSSAIRRALIGICQEVSKQTDDNNSKMVMLKLRISKLSKIFSDSAVIERILMRFVNQMSEDEQTFEHVKYLISDDYTTEGVQTNAQQLIQRTIERKTISAKQDNSFIAFRRFMDRCSPLIMDSEAAKCLIDLVASTVIGREQKKKQCEENYKSDLILLEIWTDHFAHIFTSGENVEKIRKDILRSDDHQAVETGLSAINSIFSISGFRNRLNSDEGKRKWSDRFINGLFADLNEIILREEPEFRRSSKLAVRLLKVLGIEKAVEFCDENLDILLSRLESKNLSCANSFQALAEMFSVKPSKYAIQFLEMIEKNGIIEKICEAKENEEDISQFQSAVSLRDHAIPASTLAKIYAMKLATKVLIETTQVMREDMNDLFLKNLYKSASDNFIRILSKIIENKGTIDNKSIISNLEVQRGRLRGSAATCLMKLCIYPNFREKVEARTILAMSYMVLDEQLVVRIHFVMSLKKQIKKCLPIDFAACFALSSLLDDESEETKAFKRLCFDLSVTIYSSQTTEIADNSNLQGSSRVKFVSEPVIAYLFWLLTHWPKFSEVEDISALCEVRESIWTMIEAQRKAKCDMQIVWQTIELLRKYGDRMIRDENGGAKKKIDETMEHNKKLWAMTDLATYLMLYRAKIEQKNAGVNAPPAVNRQYFYNCPQKTDLTEVYIPDELIDDEKQRNGKLPKKGKAYFQHKTNVSKSHATKRKSPRSKKAPNSSFTLFEEDENEEIMIEDNISDIADKSVYDIPLSEEENEKEEEELEKVKMGRKKRISAENGTSPEKKKSRKSNHDLEDTLISPIVTEGAGTSRNTRKSAKLTASTPFRVEQSQVKRRGKRSAAKVEEEEEEEDEENVEEEEEEVEKSPKKKNQNGKQKQPVVTTTRSSRSRGSAPEPITSPKPKRGNSKKQSNDVFDIPQDDDEPIKTKPKRKARK